MRRRHTVRKCGWKLCHRSSARCAASPVGSHRQAHARAPARTRRCRTSGICSVRARRARCSPAGSTRARGRPGRPVRRVHRTPRHAARAWRALVRTEHLLGRAIGSRGAQHGLPAGRCRQPRLPGPSTAAWASPTPTPTTTATRRRRRCELLQPRPSSTPRCTFMACTAAPLAPLPRLSSRRSASPDSSLAKTKMSTRLVSLQAMHVEEARHAPACVRVATAASPSRNARRRSAPPARACTPRRWPGPARPRCSGTVTARPL